MKYENRAIICDINFLFCSVFLCNGLIIAGLKKFYELIRGIEGSIHGDNYNHEIEEYPQ